MSAAHLSDGRVSWGRFPILYTVTFRTTSLGSRMESVTQQLRRPDTELPTAAPPPPTPSQSSRRTFILVRGLDPTLTADISCSILIKSTLNSIQTY